MGDRHHPQLAGKIRELKVGQDPALRISGERTQPEGRTLKALALHRVQAAAAVEALSFRTAARPGRFRFKAGLGQQVAVNV